MSVATKTFGSVSQFSLSLRASRESPKSLENAHLSDHFYFFDMNTQMSCVLLRNTKFIF